MEAPLDKIINVDTETNGFYATLLQYGSLRIKIFGLPDGLIVDKIKEPQNVKAEIMKAKAVNS